MKVLLWTDLHLGINKGNHIFHKISLDYALWLKDQAHKNKIGTLIFCGDFFHSRTSIDLLTLQTGFQFLDILSDFQIHMIPGNHCSWFSDNSTIHSLNLIKRWPNIHIYDTPTTILGNISMIPWGTSLEGIPSNDIICGHFNVRGYEYGKNRISDHGFVGIDLMEKCNKYVFSGHYHKPQKRKYGDKEFMFLGSTFQLSYGETEEDKFIYILDTETFEIEKIENNISPKFVYLKSAEDWNNIENNFVSMQVKAEEYDEVITKIKLHNPLDIRTETIDELITISNDDKLTEDVKEFKIIDIPEVISSCINDVQSDILSNKDREQIKNDLIDMYNRFI